MQRQPIIWYLLLYALFLAAMHFGYDFGVTGSSRNLKDRIPVVAAARPPELRRQTLS